LIPKVNLLAFLIKGRIKLILILDNKFRLQEVYLNRYHSHDFSCVNNAKGQINIIFRTNRFLQFKWRAICGLELDEGVVTLKGISF
jgi:hypothetical protein